MTISRTRVIAILFGAAATTWGAVVAFAQDTEQCAGLPSQGALKNALTLARHQANGGFNLDMWATVEIEAPIGLMARERQSIDRKSTRLNSSHDQISYAVFCLKKKTRRSVAHE